MLSHWECYALAVAGVLGFVLQQVSLGTGRLAPSVATVSVANPIVGILIGVLLLDERLSQPGLACRRRRDRVSASRSSARSSSRSHVRPHRTSPPRTRRACLSRPRSPDDRVPGAMPSNP